MQIFSYNNLHPEIAPSVFIAPGAVIIGDVVIGKGSSIWFNAVVRGDVNYIRIGEESNIQDGSVLHVTNKTAPLIIGSKVTIGHMACLHGCTINDASLIGMGATVLDGAVIESKALVAAGSVVRPGFIVPSGKLAAGIPAKVVRELTQDELDYFEISARHYLEYSIEMQKGLAANI